MQLCLLVFCGFLSVRLLFRFCKPNKSKLPFVVFCQVFGVGGTDVLTLCSTSVMICFCERTQLILKNVMIQFLNIFLKSLIKINLNIYLD